MKRLPVLLALCGLAAAEEPERVRQAYDVRFLTRTMEDFQGPSLDAEAARSIFTIDESVEDRALTGEFLASAIVTNFDEDSWSDARNSIEFRDGVLYVTQTKENHASIAEYLEMLRRRFSRRVLVEGDVLLLSPAAFAATGAAPGLLAPATEAALRDAAADGGKGRTASILRAIAMNGQRVYAADVVEETYVRDYDIEIAQAASVADPVTGTIASGAVLDVRPVLSPDGATAMLEVRFAFTVPGATESFEPAAPPLGTLQLPRRRNLRCKSTVQCPMGRTVLLCAGSGQDADGSRVAAVLVRPTLVGGAAGDSTESKEKRQMRIFDVSSLCSPVRDFPGSALEIVDTGIGSPTTSFVPPSDEGISLDPEALIETVRANVAKNSWSNSRNKIWTMGTQVVVVQTPEVLKEIGEFLAVAVPQRAKMVGIEAVVVALTDAGWEARRQALTAGIPAEADLRSLMESAAQGGDARIAAAAAAVGMNDQRFHMWAGRDRAYVQDYDVEIAQSASATDPVVGWLRDGLVLDVRPMSGGDGKQLQLELRPAFVEAGDFETIDAKAPNVGRIQRVRAARFAPFMQPLVAENTWALLSTATCRFQGRRETLILLARARSMEAK
jgi:hypothetical protein